MRKPFYVLLLAFLTLSLFVLALAQQPTRPTELPKESQISRPSKQSEAMIHNCHFGGGIACSGPGFNCLVMFPDTKWPMNLRRSAESEKQTVKGKISIREGRNTTLQLELTSAPSAEAKSATIDLGKDIPLDNEVAKSLGYKSVTILKGKYLIDPKIGSYGAINYSVKVAK